MYSKSYTTLLLKPYCKLILFSKSQEFHLSRWCGKRIEDENKFKKTVGRPCEGVWPKKESRSVGRSPHCLVLLEDYSVLCIARADLPYATLTLLPEDTFNSAIYYTYNLVAFASASGTVGAPSKARGNQGFVSI